MLKEGMPRAAREVDRIKFCEPISPATKRIDRPIVTIDRVSRDFFSFLFSLSLCLLFFFSSPVFFPFHDINNLRFNVKHFSFTIQERWMTAVRELP